MFFKPFSWGNHTLQFLGGEVSKQKTPAGVPAPLRKGLAELIGPASMTMCPTKSCRALAHGFYLKTSKHLLKHPKNTIKSFNTPIKHIKNATKNLEAYPPNDFSTRVFLETQGRWTSSTAFGPCRAVRRQVVFFFS